MRIKKILSRNRCDFHAVYQCEYCNDEHEDYGYDDDFFRSTVIPNLICKVCGYKTYESCKVLEANFPE